MTNKETINRLKLWAKYGGTNMSKHVSARYIKEKMRPIENLIETVNNAESDNLSEEIRYPEEIAFAFAVIAKEIGVRIPEV